MIPDATLHLLQNLGTAAWLLIIGVALVRGGRPERVAAVTLLIDLAVVELFRGFNGLSQLQWRNLVGDVVVLGVLVLLATTSRRRWLPWAVGAQIAAVLVHAPRMFDSHIRNVGYATVATLLGYGVMGLLLWGTLTEARLASET